jgi:hypothetical protein
MIEPLPAIAAVLNTALNSSFSVAAVGAFAGAAAGALGAQRVIERTKRRRDLLDALNDTNAAIMISFSITNTTLRFKSQLVAPMYKNFQAGLSTFQSFLTATTSPQLQSPEEFKLQAEFVTFMCPALPLESLKHLVYHKVSSHGKVLDLMAQVENASSGLAHSIAKREKLADEFRELQKDKDWAYRYFGIRHPNGSTYREHADLIAVIDEYCSDLLWFSAELSSQLVKHGEALRKRFTALYGQRDLPKVSSPDFSRPKASGLFPPDSNYTSWAASFAEN